VTASGQRDLVVCGQLPDEGIVSSKTPGRSLPAARSGISPGLRLSPDKVQPFPGSSLRAATARPNARLPKLRIMCSSVACSACWPPAYSGPPPAASCPRSSIARKPAGTVAARRHRTDAIVAVLATSGTGMSIQDVIAGLGEAGRPDETYDNVAADLAYLSDRGRARRVSRGVCAAASP
jgi:hypothetical protein